MSWMQIYLNNISQIIKVDIVLSLVDMRLINFYSD